ncbi:hypothetical protein [Pelagicoccus sp. SDUM812005]|uniref:hypothetical protein n=1 Tax=Pelagicoccus sp. SDUM812005 TaxID=3041257 RepID=UPI00280F84EB|nr:hypothetical protein [Pelagicoccus sp. SDUM812005]MDQ8183878.1 hypothetical protein [Pelagicoccus sp. SDUM812005]
MTNQDQIIGYAGLDIREGCYEYFENECCITDSIETAEKMMKESYTCFGEYKLEAITIEEIIKDFGFSGRSYAFEPEAFTRFKKIAKENKVSYSSRIDRMPDPPLMIVHIED